MTVPVSVLAQEYPPFGSKIPNVSLTGSALVQEPPPNPPDQQSQWNTELVGYSDLQGRSAYQPIIINETGREIAYVGHHTGSAMNPITGVVEPNGTSIVDVTDPAKPKYLAHIPGSAEAGEEAGGAQMVRVCSGSVLPHGDKSIFTHHTSVGMWSGVFVEFFWADLKPCDLVGSKSPFTKPSIAVCVNQDAMRHALRKRHV